MAYGCGGCGERFGGVRTFDLHQQPEGTCHPPGGRGLLLGDDGIWRRASSPDAPFRVGHEKIAGLRVSPGTVMTPGSLEL